MKIPESERPPMREVEMKHFGHLPFEAKRFLVPDIQNDCTCSVEIYEADPAGPALVLSPDGVDVIDKAIRVALPIHNGRRISQEDLRLLYKVACRFASDSPAPDVSYFETLSSDDDYDYMVPDPEYFGVLTCNLAGWGAFCFPKQIWRKRKEDVRRKN